MAQLIKDVDLVSYTQVVQQQEWVDAMNDELDALELNDTWEITDLPSGKKAIGSKWIYKTKFKPDGHIERHKSILVIQGCRQQYGVDYGETLTPIAKLTTVRALLAVAAIEGWIVNQMDVKNAFLHGDLHEDVYMKLPLGYTGAGCRVSLGKGELSSQTRVCKLEKSLYGLRQSPRQWFFELSTALRQFGYEQSKNDHTLFTKTHDKEFVTILVYVDDLILAGNYSSLIN